MSIGIWQVVLILLIVLIIFGAGKLPKVMGDVAKGVKNFKAGLKDEGEAEGDPKVLRAEQPVANDTATATTTAAPAAATVKQDEVAKG